MTDQPAPRPARRFWRALPPALLIACLVGLILHLGVRDRIPGLWMVYYLLPLPVLAALAAMGFVLALLQKRPILRRVL
jgi:hypothetical protein